MFGVHNCVGYYWIYTNSNPIFLIHSFFRVYLSDLPRVHNYYTLQQDSSTRTLTKELYTFRTFFHFAGLFVWKLLPREIR